ncbi:MAG: hypothetical protein HQL37_08330 [Alphaproteobacteria bacterium]|nr:hypothetical protein [Alphaproteobacteria bacterium]
MDNRDTFIMDQWPALQNKAGSAIMFPVFREVGSMVAVRKPSHDATDDDSVFDDADALIALAQRSFTKAAKRAVAENDALGIPTSGSVNGQIVFRVPPTKATL